jgi:hypothetical protein
MAFQKLTIRGKEENYRDEAMLSVRASLYIPVRAFHFIGKYGLRATKIMMNP